MPNGRAIVFTDKLKAEIQTIDLADPGPGEFITRTLVSLISTGTECICFRAESDPGSHWDSWVKHPFNPGYSNVGEVIAVGEGVDQVELGQRIFTSRPHHEFHCHSVSAGDYNMIPDAISNEEATWAKLATISQTGVRRAEVELGDSVVVVGLGPLGLLITQYLRVSGCERIIAIDPLQDRLDVALKHGATHTFQGSAADAADFVTENCDGDLADITFDVTGHYSVFPMVLKLAKRFGKVMLVGDSPHPHLQHLEADLITRQLHVRGSHNEMLACDEKWNANRQRDLFFTYLERGQMTVKDMISQTYNPEDAQTVYSNLIEDRTGTMGVLFNWRA